MKNKLLRGAISILTISFFLTSCAYTEPQEKIDTIDNYVDDAITLYDSLYEKYCAVSDGFSQDTNTSSLQSPISDFLNQWNEFDLYCLDYFTSTPGTNSYDMLPASPEEEKNSETAFDIAFYTTFESGALTEVTLKYVVDGDTLYVELNGDNAYIRLIGINTPESVHPDVSKNTEDGIDASTHTKELLIDTEHVYLEFDKCEYDTYGRVLAYVWLSADTSNSDNMLNVRLLKDGMAEIMTIKPNTKYAALFSSLVNDRK